MLHSKKTVILAIVSCIVILVVLVPIARAEYNRQIDCDRDSFVSQPNSGTNYGELDSIYVGNYYLVDRRQAYYHFDISGAEQGWSELVIYLDFFLAFGTINVGAGITANNWQELTINWDNQPGNGTSVEEILNNGMDVLIPVDESDFTNNEITITLYSRDGENDGYIVGASREGASFDYEVPHINLTYESIDPMLIAGIIMGVVGSAGIFGVIIYLVKNHGKKKISENGNFCTACGAEIIGGAKFCSNCGYEQG